MMNFRRIAVTAVAAAGVSLGTLVAGAAPASAGCSPEGTGVECNGSLLVSVPPGGGSPCLEVFYPDATINPTGPTEVRPKPAVVFHGVADCLN